MVKSGQGGRRYIGSWTSVMVFFLNRTNKTLHLIHFFFQQKEQSLTGIFQGAFRSHVQCSKCAKLHGQQKEESFVDFSIPVPDDEQVTVVQLFSLNIWHQIYPLGRRCDIG